MAYPDLKKLITGFLVLSSMVGSSVLIFSNFFSAPPAPRIIADSPSKISGGNLGGRADHQNAGPQIGENAFVETPTKDSNLASPEDAPSAPDITQEPPPITPSSNLTQTLIDNLAREIILANPDGPLTQDLSAIRPETGSLDNLLTKSLSGFKVEDIIKTDVSDKDINVLKDYGAHDLSEYINSVDKILNETVNKYSFGNITDPGTGAAAMAAGELTYNDAFKGIAALKTPEPIAGAHKKLITLLGHQAKVFQVAGDAMSDPVKALAVIRSDPEIISQDSQSFEEELSRVNPVLFNKTSARLSSRKLASLMGSLLSIRQAEAQGFVVPVDCAVLEGAKGCIAMLAQLKATTINTTIKNAKDEDKWIELLLTQILKNTIIKQLQRQIVNWVNGGGKPQFITNWKSFLSGAAKDAAGFAISDFAPYLCRDFGPLLRQQLYTSFLSPVERPTCTLDQVVANVKNFYNNFSNGGWIAFSQVVLPSGNYYGELFETSQIVAQKAAEAKEAQKSRGEAGQGTNPRQVCVKYVRLAGPPDENGKYPTACEEYAETTPGTAVASQISQSLNLGPENLVNAADLTGMMAAIIDSAINRLIRSGPGGFANIAAGGQQGGDAASVVCAGITDPQQLADCQKRAQNFNQPPPVEPLTITTASLPAGKVNVSYSQLLSATGGDGARTWSLASGVLPDGLSLDSAGFIFGIPTKDGAFTFTLKVQDAGTPVSSATAAFSVTIAP